MTAEQRAFIQQKINEIRGGKSSLQAQKEVADMLAGTAQQRVSQQSNKPLRLSDRQMNSLRQHKPVQVRLMPILNSVLVPYKASLRTQP
jgi:hypothetical protein